MAKIEVKSGTTHCPIHVASNTDSLLRRELKRIVKAKRIFVVVDSGFFNVNRKQFATTLSKSGFRYEVMTIHSGEKSKFTPTLLELYDWLLQHHVTRDDFLLAVGGGVVTDLAGYAAATTLRGIAWGAVPTTLLGMVDAAIGGKTAINHPRGKNMIGSFWQPSFVLCDTRWLTSLPTTELISGMGEVVKYAGLIGGNTHTQTAKFLEKKNLSDTKALTKIVLFSAAYKAKIVSADERDGNKRLWLNLGHTFAHGIEQVTGFKKLPHGMAVTLGCLAAVELSCLQEPKQVKQFDAYRDLLYSHMRHIPHVAFDTHKVLHAMQGDKKRTSRGLRFVLLHKPGAPYIAENVDMKHVQSAVTLMQTAYRQYGKRHA